MRLPLPSAAGLLLALPALSSATTITLHLPATPPPATLSPRTRATLSAPGLRLSAALADAHAFVFRNVSAGSYLADVHCPSDGFAPLRVDVAAGGGGAARAWETFRGNDWEDRGEALARRGGEDGEDGVAAFEVRALGRKVYFMERPKFSVMSILMNPMILMGLVSMVIFIGLPKLVENMDPETRAEWEASQKENPMNSILGGAGQQQANPLGNFDMAAFMAGSKKKESGGGQAAAAAASGSESKASKPQGVRR